MCCDAMRYRFNANIFPTFILSMCLRHGNFLLNFSPHERAKKRVLSVKTSRTKPIKDECGVYRISFGNLLKVIYNGKFVLQLPTLSRIDSL